MIRCYREKKIKSNLTCMIISIIPFLYFSYATQAFFCKFCWCVCVFSLAVSRAGSLLQFRVDFTRFLTVCVLGGVPEKRHKKNNNTIRQTITNHKDSNGKKTARTHTHTTLFRTRLQTDFPSAPTVCQLFTHARSGTHPQAGERFFHCLRLPSFPASRTRVSERTRKASSPAVPFRPSAKL